MKPKDQRCRKPLLLYHYHLNKVYPSLHPTSDLPLLLHRASSPTNSQNTCFSRLLSFQDSQLWPNQRQIHTFFFHQDPYGPIRPFRSPNFPSTFPCLSTLQDDPN